MDIFAYFGLDTISRCILNKFAYSSDINTLNGYNQTPLLLASQYGHIYMVKLLLEQDYIDINVVANNYKTPIFAAAKAGNLEIVELLLMRDDISTEKAFRMAVHDKVHELIRRVLSYNKLDFDINATFQPLRKHGLYRMSDIPETMTLLGYAASRPCCPDLTRLLLSHRNVDVNQKSSSGKAALLSLIEFQRRAYGPASHRFNQPAPATLHVLLEQPEIDVNAKDLDGYTALHLAASYGLQQIVRILLERSDVNVNVRTNDGKTPLHVATESDYRSQVKYLWYLLQDRPYLSRNLDLVRPRCLSTLGPHLEVELVLATGSTLDFPGSNPAGGPSSTRQHSVCSLSLHRH